MWISLFLLAGLVTPASAQIGRSTVDVPVRAEVFIVGDSIALGASNSLTNEFESAGWTVSIDARMSRPTAEGVPIVSAIGAALPDHVVVALGANDGGSWAFSRRVDEMLDALEDVPNVYWVNVSEVRDYYPATNAMIDAAVDKRDDLVVIDWSTPSLAHAWWTARDGLHLTGEGAYNYGVIVSEVVISNEASQQIARRSKAMRRGVEMIESSA
jgi:lysophospholipase L1-like esterase